VAKRAESIIDITTEWYARMRYCVRWSSDRGLLLAVRGLRSRRFEIRIWHAWIANTDSFAAPCCRCYWKLFVSWVADNVLARQGDPMRRTVITDDFAAFTKTH